MSVIIDNLDNCRYNKKTTRLSGLKYRIISFYFFHDCRGQRLSMLGTLRTFVKYLYYFSSPTLQQGYTIFRQ